MARNDETAEMRPPEPPEGDQSLTADGVDRLFGAPLFGTGFSNTQGRVGWYSSYLYRRDSARILASKEGIRVRAYTFDHTSVALDANGRRFVPAGTTLQTYAAGKCGPRTGSNDSIGILGRDIDVTDSDDEVPMVRAGALREDLCWDGGTIVGTGTLDATHVKAALPFIEFTKFNY